MNKSFTISGGNREVEVEGSLKENGKIKIHIDDNTRILDSEEGNFSMKDGEAVLRYPGGVYVEEKDVYTEIHLLDGTSIYKGPIKKHVTFSDGSYIEQETSGIPSKEDLIQVAKPNVFVFFMVIFGIISQSPFFVIMAIALYLGESGYALRHYIERIFKDQEDTDSEIARIQEEYMDGDLTEEEFEKKLDDQFSEETTEETESEQLEKEVN